MLHGLVLLLNLVEVQSHQELTHSAAQRAGSRDLLTLICGLEGSATGPTGASGGKAYLRDDSISQDPYGAGVITILLLIIILLIKN